MDNMILAPTVKKRYKFLTQRCGFRVADYTVRYDSMSNELSGTRLELTRTLPSGMEYRQVCITNARNVDYYDALGKQCVTTRYGGNNHPLKVVTPEGVHMVVNYGSVSNLQNLIEYP